MIALHKQNNREHILKKYAVHENVSFRYLPEGSRNWKRNFFRLRLKQKNTAPALQHWIVFKIWKRISISLQLLFCPCKATIPFFHF